MSNRFRTGLIEKVVNNIASACFGRKIKKITFYENQMNLSTNIILDSGEEVELPQVHRREELDHRWFDEIADIFLERLPRHDRMERKKHLNSLMKHWIEKAA